MAAELLGLVVAGGASRRMGRDKGALIYHAEPQVVHAWRLLSAVCGQAWVSTSPAHAGEAPYRDLPLIIDDGRVSGPAAALAAAWAFRPEAAWLALAVDMPRIDRRLLDELLAARDTDAVATAFRNEAGRIEPLCTIFEPAAHAHWLDALARAEASPRRILESAGAAVVIPTRPEILRGVNTPAEQAAALGELTGRERL